MPAGASHNIINTGSRSLKLYTLYAPPRHRDGVVHPTKADAEASDEHFDGRRRNRRGRRNPHVVEALMTSPPPRPDWAPIADLHPTQMTVGLREVAQKRLRWRSRIRKEGLRGAPRLVVPIVRGPAGVMYLVDRHHLVRAVGEEGVHEVLIRPIADFTALRPDDFWRVLDARGWCHPYDAAGRRRAFGEIPAEIDDPRDDPFRSLASALRRAGGFAKRSTPFCEFAWADFLRLRISSAVAMDFEWALGRALSLARTPAARGLPGWMAEPHWNLDASASSASPNVAR